MINPRQKRRHLRAFLPLLAGFLSIAASSAAADDNPANTLPGYPNPVEAYARPIDETFHRELRDDAWSQAYQSALLAAPLTLDDAIRFRFFAPPRYTVGIGIAAGLHSPAAEQARADKRAAALPVLSAELDSRFKILADALNTETRVAAPPHPVSYCDWIWQVQTSTPIPDVVKQLAQRCAEDRIAYLTRVALRFADQQPLAGLPLTDPLQPKPPMPPAERANDFSFMPTDLMGAPPASQPPREAALAMVYPADRNADDAITAMNAIFAPRLKQRYDALGDQMERSLLDAVTGYAAAGVISAPDQECVGLLGSYALVPPNDVRFDLSKRLVTACRQAVQATVEPHLQQIVAAVHQKIVGDPIEKATVQQIKPTCFALWRPYFNLPPNVAFTNFANTGLTGKQTYELGNPCQADVNARNQAIYRQRLAAVIARVKAAPPTRSGLEKTYWFELTDADFDWVPRVQNPLDQDEKKFRDGAIDAFKAAFEKVAAPLRQTATDAALKEIDDAFKGNTVSAPHGVDLCQPYVSPASGIRPLPLIAGDAGPKSLLVTACARDLRALSVARMQKALTEAGMDTLNGLSLAVKAPSGALVSINADAMIKAAATDGIQISFVPGGLISYPSIEIRSFNPDRPTLKGKLVKTRRADDMQVMLVDDLAVFPDFDGPLDTLLCLSTTRENGQWQTVFVGLAGMAALEANDGSTAEASRDLYDAYRSRISSQQCTDAKHWLTGEWPADVFSVKFVGQPGGLAAP